MSLELNSLSSSLLLGTTLYRNQPGVVNKVSAQVSYALIAKAALVETIAALALTALSLLAYPFSHKHFEHNSKWLSSSAFAFGWAVTNFVLNLFTGKLVADERRAREVLYSGHLFRIPAGALV